MHTGERDTDGLPRHRIAAVDVVRRFRTGTSGRHATLLACAMLVAGACGGGEAPLVRLGENPPSAHVLTAPTTAPRTDTNGTAAARVGESGDPGPSRLPANPAERPIRLHESTRSPLERGGVFADTDGWEPSPPEAPNPDPSEAPSAGIAVEPSRFGPDQRLVTPDNTTSAAQNDRGDPVPPPVTAPSPPDVGSVESLTATSSETPAAGAFDDSSRTTAPGGDTLDEHAVAGDPTVTAAATGPPFGSGGTLADLLAELVRVATVWNPDGRASIAVVTPEGALHGVNENRPHLSASAVKPLWTAVAIVHAGSSAVAPFAQPTLAQSDNHAAGKVIDLIGIDTVNAWTRETAGLTGTHTACWNYGKARLSRSAIDGGGCANRTTAADLANFYARLGGNELLDPDDTAALEGWLRDTPRGSASSVTTAGALLARLPPAVAAE